MLTIVPSGQKNEANSVALMQRNPFPVKIQPKPKKKNAFCRIRQPLLRPLWFGWNLCDLSNVG